MSQSEPVSVDGVTVEKAFETDEFPVPTVTFTITSERDATATVRVVDRIPDSIGMDQVGFHPDYDSDDWTAYPDNRVEFECELDPGESIRTVYGVQMQDAAAEQFDAEPELAAEPVGELGESEASDPVEGATMSDIADRENTDVVRDVIGGERDTVPGLDEESDEEPATADGADAGADDGDGVLGTSSDDESDVLDGLGDEEEADADEADDEPDSVADDEAGTGADAGAVTTDPEAVAAALATAIREDAVSEDDLDTIAGAMGRSRSSTVELESLHRRVGELEAYTAALEEFIDENGTATELLSRVEGDLDALDERVSALSEDVDAAADDREAIRAEVQDLDALEALEDDLQTLRGDLDALDERVAATENDVDDLDALEDDVEAVEEDIAELREWRDQLSDVFGA